MQGRLDTVVTMHEVGRVCILDSTMGVLELAAILRDLIFIRSSITMKVEGGERKNKDNMGI